MPSLHDETPYSIYYHLQKFNQFFTFSFHSFIFINSNCNRQFKKLCTFPVVLCLVSQTRLQYHNESCYNSNFCNLFLNESMNGVIVKMLSNFSLNSSGCQFREIRQKQDFCTETMCKCSSIFSTLKKPTLLEKTFKALQCFSVFYIKSFVLLPCIYFLIQTLLCVAVIRTEQHNP